VAWNLVVTRARHARVVARATPRSTEAAGADPTARTIVDRESWGELEAALGRMPDDERELLVLAAAGTTGIELARRLGISHIATRTRLCRARRRLRDQMDRDPPIRSRGDPRRAAPP
jgi:DNA-directed RNA polymerase specialized sigma24 family protein